MDRAAYQREYRAKNLEKIKQRKAAYYVAHREEIRLKQNANPDKKAYMKEWHLKNKELEKAYADKNREKLNACARKRRAKNIEAAKEKERAKRKNQYSKNKERFLFDRKRDRPAKFGVECSLKREQHDQILEKQNGLCLMCNQNKKLTIDHIIPLSRGGGHTERNIQFLCRSCNSKKRNKLPEEMT